MKPMEDAINSKELPITDEQMAVLFGAIPDLINVRFSPFHLCCGDL